MPGIIVAYPMKLLFLQAALLMFLFAALAQDPRPHIAHKTVTRYAGVKVKT